MSNRYTDEEYLESVYLIFEDRDTVIKNRTTRIVTTRKPHVCLVPGENCGHPIAAGVRAVLDVALVDGEWGRYYCCLDCIDRCLADLEVPNA